MAIRQLLEQFAQSVYTKLNQLTQGEGEEQLRAPLETLFHALGPEYGLKIVAVGETLLKDSIGRPDFAIMVNGLLAGYVELKAVGVGAIARRFTGHNKEQFKRFSVIPNILYTDGNEWALYRNGTMEGKLLRLGGDISTDGKAAIEERDAQGLDTLLREFLGWEPIVPTNGQGKVDLRGFAELLAPLCRMLRDDVSEALTRPNSPLVSLASDWRDLLFPDAPDDQFADAYAQTVCFALLLGRSESDAKLSVDMAVHGLAAHHNLLSRALQVLTDERAYTEIKVSLDLLLRVIAVVPSDTMTGPDSPWLYFYEHFLAVYDPELRRDAGAYYTPIEVVHAQVRLIDELLVKRLNKPMGFADPQVITLDPATGTGTYLLGVIEHALGKVRQMQGEGAVPGQASALAHNLYGFELMVGPYAVTELRVSQALQQNGAIIPPEGTHIYLTDTLESPNATAPNLPYFLKPIAEQHARALKVKKNIPVLVCLGNPPYDRHGAIDQNNPARSGGWVNWGDAGDGSNGIMQDFKRPAIEAGFGGHLRNLYNLYVYFWRWSLWKVFEQDSGRKPGVVSFITASSYLQGPAFSGMREHMRRMCDEIWIIDLGGEGRGTRKDDNVFAIQTPVCIAVAVRYGHLKREDPAAVHYTRIEGSRAQKLAQLEQITDFKTANWQTCPTGWQAFMAPSGIGDYFAWPMLIDLMPWQEPGMQFKRKWPISYDRECLVDRWRTLCSSHNKGQLYVETDHTIDQLRVPLPIDQFDSTPIVDLNVLSPVPPVLRYAHRSFERQWILADARLCDRPKMSFWRVHSLRQLYITSLLTQSLGVGPALSACSDMPDLHHFSNRGAKDIIPLYRDKEASEANIHPDLLPLLSGKLSREVSAEQWAAYLYGILAHPAFTESFAKELETRELRVPITTDPELFEAVRQMGARLLWLHTYGQRLVPEGHQLGAVPPGQAKCLKAIPGDLEGYPEGFSYNQGDHSLSVGDGLFGPVSPKVFEFEVSGLKVVHSWLRYRMKGGAGRKSSPLDDIRPERWTSQFTTELLELLWVLEATVAEYPRMAELLAQVVAGECLGREALPEPPAGLRKPPSGRPEMGSLF